MKALSTKLHWVLMSSMTLLFICLSLSATAQKAGDKTVIITTKTLDKNGKEVVEKIKLKGTDASEEAIEKLIQEAVGDGKSVDVEIEESISTTNKDDAEQLMKTYSITLDGAEDVETEVTIEIEEEEKEGDKQKAKKIQKKEVRIIKMSGDKNSIDLNKILEEHNIDLEDGEGTKEIRIIKMKSDGKDVDVDELLKEHNIDVEDGNGKKKKVKVIKMKGNKDGASNKDVRIIEMKGGEELKLGEENELIESGEDEEDKVVIFQGEDGTTQVIKQRKKEVLQWAQREDVEEKLVKMGIVLPDLGTPVANYVHAVTTSDNLIFLAGKGPKKADGTYITGKLGRDLTVKEGYEAARQTGILQLAALKGEIGDLNRVKRIVKVLGMVNCTADFGDQPEVINGFSDLMVEVFGERGKHARAAVGMYALPRNIAVEIEMIVEIE